MRAVVFHEYGPPDVLGLEEVPRPTPAKDEVLVRIRASSLNASDWEYLNGTPAYVRMWGLRRPKFPILGSDIAGVVEAVGADVVRFAPGDEVLGDVLGTFGGFAEFACAKENTLTKKPAALDFATAAALPQAAIVALQGIRDAGGLRAGEHVLINGAGGGAGTFAIQIAKSIGAEVTAVDNEHKQAAMLALGADHVVDYRTQDFTAGGARFDLVLDLVGSRSLPACRRALRDGGRYLMVGGSVGRLVQALLLGPLLSATGPRMRILAVKSNEGMTEVLDMVERGVLAPVIAKRFELADVPDAFACLGAGLANGKLVVDVN